MIKMIVVSHTHWDREWYLSFQRFRVRLVRMMDELLDILKKDPRFTSFTLDGQTVLLEDYLEVKPERRAALQKHVREGKLLIGPWYTSPEEFLVSAEALIRNLMLGHRIAAQFGDVMKVGYLPDSFGQMAQLPQILQGFGISSAVFWRGVGDEPGKMEFIWRAPDGSEVLAVHLREGYGNAADLPAGKKALSRRLTEIEGKVAPYATSEYILLMNGGDHHSPQANLPNVLSLTEGVVQGTLPMYIEAVREANPPLPTVEGEFRCAKYAYLLPGTLSSRTPLKQRNAAVQTLLERWAEPFSAWAALVTSDKLVNLQPLIWQAWKYLLQNHAHDSITGCNIDAVQREMELRFDWAEEIADEVTSQSLKAIVGSIDTAQLTKGEKEGSPLFIPIVVFNPLGVSRTDVVSLSFQPLTSLEDFVIVDGQGREVPHRVLSGCPIEVFSAGATREEFVELLQMAGRGEVFDLRIASFDIEPLERGTMGVTFTLVKKEAAPEVDFEALTGQAYRLLEDEAWQRFVIKGYFAPEVRLSFLAEDVPSCGYKAYALTRGEGQGCRGAGKQGRNTLRFAPSNLQNEFFAVEVDPTDGTLTITDKETGLVYRGCNRFVDDGEAGDLYWHEAPARDLVVDRPAGPPRVSIERDALGATLRVEMEYSLPAGLTEDRKARSEEWVICPLVTTISLYPGVRRIDIRTEIENRARNHRLRVHFPTPIETDHSCAEGAFGAVERPVDLPSGEGWVERPVGTHPQGSFVAVSDGTKGLMLINRGLPEYEVIERGTGGVTVALTLLRCVDRLSRGAEVLTPLAQCQGQQAFDYALVPHTDDLPYHEAHAFNASLRALATAVHQGSLPPEMSFVSIEPRCLMLSAVKVAESGDGLILRLYNPTSEVVEGKVHLYRPFAEARLVRLDEEDLGQPPLHFDPEGGVRVRVGGKAAVTIKFE